MRSVGISAVVVLVVLQTVRLSGAPIDTTIETTAETTIETTTVPLTTTTFCLPPSCEQNCFLDTYSGGCPTQCICGDPICMLVSCGPDEDCVPNNDYSSSGYTCVPRYETTIETTTIEPTTIETYPPCEDMSWCPGSCYLTYTQLYSGCPLCMCGGYLNFACKYASCGPDEDCVPYADYSYSYEYTCVPRYDTTTCPPIECDVPSCMVENGPDGCPEKCFCETSLAPTTCPPIQCDDPNCFVENGPDGCPAQCICGDPICMIMSCGLDEQCVPSEYNSRDYTCVSTSGTTVADP